MVEGRRALQTTVSEAWMKAMAKDTGLRSCLGGEESAGTEVDLAMPGSEGC